MHMQSSVRQILVKVSPNAMPIT